MRGKAAKAYIMKDVIIMNGPSEDGIALGISEARLP
jgi:hypothetical protein